MPEFNENELPALREEIQGLEIVDPDSYQYADTRLALVKQAEKFFKNRHQANIKRTKLAYDGARQDLENDVTPLQGYERTLKDLMVGYKKEQSRIAEITALELRKEEMAKAEQESLEVAELLESVGHNQEAEAVLDRPDQAPPVVVKPNIPKSETSHFAKSWKYEVKDFKALVMAVAGDKVPLKALEYSKDFLNRQANAQKEVLDYPGVRTYWVEDIRSRS